MTFGKLSIKGKDRMGHMGNFIRSKVAQDKGGILKGDRGLEN